LSVVHAAGNPGDSRPVEERVTLSVTWPMSPPRPAPTEESLGDDGTAAPTAAVAVPPSARVAAGRAAEALADEAIVRGCQAGDRAAMHAFYARYQRRVFGLIARICGAQEAEELTQEVFLRAFRAIDRFRGDAQLSTWMYRLAVNAALSHAGRTMARDKKRRDVTDDELAQLPAPATGEGDPRLRQHLERALGELPAGYRAVIVLHDVEGLQHDEIAAILGCRVGTSKSQLHKARAQMRKKLEALAIGPRDGGET
jgi:RNA polymerase sigma-70 factor (ECF subfamily)